MGLPASRVGDITEIKAVAWLMEQGYEVFRNAGCTGPADIVVWDIESGVLTPVDVKTLTPFLCKDGGMSYVPPKPKYESVFYLLYLKHLDQFVWHKDFDSKARY